uniref:Putative is1 transposase n=1 Tax=Ixodes ricinus TaxID=34613 RepID=A0A6B0V024_IXORI
MPASLSAWATPMSASRLTAAVRALPREVRYSTRSNTSLMVKLRISMPMRPMSGAATSLTREANWSRSRYTSSTVRVPRMARRCPSRVCRMTALMWSTSLPRNCSAAVERNSRSVITLHWATPVTVRGTPCEVSTCSHRGVRVITSRDSLWTSVTSHHAQAQPPTTIFLPAVPQHPPDTMRASLGPTV